jgi:tryptophanyl-tRNA synthetase
MKLFRPDVFWYSVDGALNIESYTNNFVSYYDVCNPWPLDWTGRFDWIFSVEIGEHIPPFCESNYVNLLTSSAKYGAIMSWSDEYSLPYHPNARSEEYVVNLMKQHNFTVDIASRDKVRESILFWKFLIKNMMIYRRVS